MEKIRLTENEEVRKVQGMLEGVCSLLDTPEHYECRQEVKDLKNHVLGFLDVLDSFPDMHAVRQDAIARRLQEYTTCKNLLLDKLSSIGKITKSFRVNVGRGGVTVFATLLVDELVKLQSSVEARWIKHFFEACIGEKVSEVKD